MALNYKVFLHSHPGFNSDSTLFYGERDAVLIDACQLLSDAHRMAAELLLMGKNLTHIYVSHFHPDHHFGLAVLQHAFPEARIVALPSVVKDIVFTSTDKMDLWGGPFGKNIPSKVVFPMPLPDARLEVEGHELEFSDDWEGDSANNSVVWVPSLRLACATDVAFLDVHLWTTESDAARRNKWRASIKKLHGVRSPVIVSRPRQRGEAPSRGHVLRRLLAHLSRQVRRGSRPSQDRAGPVGGHGALLSRDEGRGLRAAVAVPAAVPQELPRLVRPASGRAWEDLPGSRGQVHRGAPRE